MVSNVFNKYPRPIKVSGIYVFYYCVVFKIFKRISKKAILDT